MCIFICKYIVALVFYVFGVILSVFMHDICMIRTICVRECECVCVYLSTQETMK